MVLIYFMHALGFLTLKFLQDSVRFGAIILLRRRGHATPIVTVQILKYFSVTKNGNIIAQVRTHACQYCHRTCFKNLIVALKNAINFTHAFRCGPIISGPLKLGGIDLSLGPQLGAMVRARIKARARGSK